MRVAICLWRLATNLEFRSLSHLFGIGISTACLITQEVTTAINNTMGKMLIKVPTAAQLRAIMQAFRDKWHFPQVVGAIDGTHIGILAPSDTPADYYNRKGFHSVILQGMVDHRMMFWDISIGFSGKVHDEYLPTPHSTAVLKLEPCCLSGLKLLRGWMCLLLSWGIPLTLFSHGS
ncbi:hypothetical protein JOQ06_006906 [Pogonophryne albipinna]|uniref:DDE Tnp4 domain-containing protein n=1 Tax=Pogonophryne albipinna TaxID=1090488 RepID=A0AAD6B0L2_9TELE|nr:hypothetical protein JOQ06_006906 [Pogonophryne albipinna]